MNSKLERIIPKHLSCKTKELANMNDHDMDFENPKTIDDLLAEELLFMTAKERNAIQEEVHGVICLSPAETPEFVDKCIDDLAREIDKIPTSEKQAYLRSQKNSIESRAQQEFPDEIFEGIRIRNPVGCSATRFVVGHCLRTIW